MKITVGLLLMVASTTVLAGIASPVPVGGGLGVGSIAAVTALLTAAGFRLFNEDGNQDDQ